MSPRTSSQRGTSQGSRPRKRERTRRAQIPSAKALRLDRFSLFWSGDTTPLSTKKASSRKLRRGFSELRGLSYLSPPRAAALAVSTLTGGPMVEVKVTERR